MRYQGSEAYSVETAERRRERLERQARPSLEVVSGGGLDARARAGVSTAFVARVRVALVLAAVLICMGMARVALSAATVSLLQSNADLSAQIEDAQALNSDLRIERSVLSSNSRISRIATQNYGMVLSTESVSVTAGQTPDDGAATPDGEAAQSTGETGASTDLS